MFNDAALLSRLSEGALLEIMDMEYKSDTKGEVRSGTFKMPEDMYKIAVLLKNPNRYAVSSARLTHDVECGNEFVSASTDRLHNITGKYEGKDDPIMLVRAQKQFPAVEEVIQQFTYAHLVPGGARGSHVAPLMPIRMNFYTGWDHTKNPSMEPFCCPIVSSIGYSIIDGRISQAVDHFDSHIFDEVRKKAATKFAMIRENGFIEPAMLPDGEVEYVEGYGTNLRAAESRFAIRGETNPQEPSPKSSRIPPGWGGDVYLVPD